MLISKPVAEGSTVTLKLTSGEELVARFNGETDTHYKLSKPVVLTMTQQGIGMVPYLITVDQDQDVTLNKATVTVISNTNKQAADQYIQGTTGIKLV